MVCVLCGVTSLSHAATRYVETWGNDMANLPNCKKSTPCRTIGAVLGVSGANDRIVVGPGTYTENGLNVLSFQSGLKLESSAGRHATTIESTIGNPALTVWAEKVRIGKKGKGFTFIGGVTEHLAGLYINAPGEFPRIRVEGNQFGLPREASDAAYSGYRNYHGLYVFAGGGKMQVRYNLFTNNDAAGFRCDDCSQALIRDNRIEGNDGAGISIQNSGRVSILRNMARANSSSGIHLSGFGKIKSNVSNRNLVGIGLSGNGESSQIDDNIADSNDFRGIDVTGTSTDSASAARRNLMVDNGFNGYRASFSAYVNATGNIAIGTTGDGFEFNQVPPPAGSFSKNAAINSGGCAIRTDSTVLIADRFFATGNTGGDACEVNPDEVTISAPMATRPPALGIRRAANVVGG